MGQESYQLFKTRLNEDYETSNRPLGDKLNHLILCMLQWVMLIKPLNYEGDDSPWLCPFSKRA